MKEFWPVLSATIRDKADPQKILLGVRDPRTNITHPNVLSTPTIRISNEIAHALNKNVTLVDVAHEYTTFPERVYRTSVTVNAPIYTAQGFESDCANPLLLAVNMLLSKKLGPSHDFPKFHARLGSIIEGEALYDVPRHNTTPIHIRGQIVHAEPIRMYGIDVLVEDVSFAASTESYSALRWVEEKMFKEILKTRSAIPAKKVFGNNTINYCAHGLCLLSAAAMLNQKNTHYAA